MEYIIRLKSKMKKQDYAIILIIALIVVVSNLPQI